jgi:deferrochelatase/peroxidase EfeB
LPPWCRRVSRARAAATCWSCAGSTTSTPSRRYPQRSRELNDEEKPPDAHIARVEIEDEDGEELPIYRRSVPYGTLAEHGLYFVAFSADLGRFSRMLSRMFGSDGDGLHDHLTDFSRPVSGAFYFAPPLTLLADLAEGWGEEVVTSATGDLTGA